MVMADSHEIPRAPCYSGPPQRRRPGFTYRTLTVYGRPSQTIRLPKALYHSPPARQNQPETIPQPRKRNTHRLSHAHGLACSPFAHHYSGNHKCFLFLRVLRCFTSPRPHQLPYTFRQRRHPTTSARLPHSETPGSQPGCRLPEEYRRLPRPSSDPDAKASTMRPQQLENTKTQQTKYRRYSRPLYKTQKTTHPTPSNPPQATQEQTGTKKTTPTTAGARFLRTQQRTQTKSQHPTQPTHPTQPHNRAGNNTGQNAVHPP
jgi:hypothetical protein